MFHVTSFLYNWNPGYMVKLYVAIQANFMAVV